MLQTPASAVAAFSGTDAVGVYRLRMEDKRTYCYTGQADVEESNLAPCTADDWKKAQEFVPMTYLTDHDANNSPLARPESRLSCQLRFEARLDGAEFQIPERQDAMG